MPAWRPAPARRALSVPPAHQLEQRLPQVGAHLRRGLELLAGQRDLLALGLRAELLKLDAVGFANLLRAGQRPQLLGNAAQEEGDGLDQPARD